MATLTREQAWALQAYLTAIELYASGVWGAVEGAMRDEFGIDDPESALADAQQALEA